MDLYRPSYKRLEKVRQNFFNKVEQDLDLENFITYYKWIDQAVSEMILQLIPASVNFGDGVTDVIDSSYVREEQEPKKNRAPRYN